MFASFSALASLLMLTSSANIVSAEMTPFLFAAIAAEDDMVPFTFDIDFKFTDPEANKITESSKQTIEGCIVSSFNEVHDPKVIQLYTAKVTKLDIKPMASHLLYGAKEEAKLSSEGEGNYSLDGTGAGSGATCRRCKSMLGSPFFIEWQNAFDKCLLASGADGLGDVSGVEVTIMQSFETPLEVAQDDMVPFAFDVQFKFNDPNANEITDSSKTAIEKCIVSSFNDVHDPNIVQLSDATVTKLEVKPMAMILVGDSLSSEGEGNYSLDGTGAGSGATCRRCKSMLGSPFFIEWQNALNQCLLDSGADGLDGVSGVEVSISTKTAVARVEVAEDDMVPFEYTIHMTATDPDANKITDSSKTAIEGCLVSSFNEVNDPKVIQLSDATLTKLEVKPMAMTLLRGSLTSTGNYSLDGTGAGSGATCRRCKSMLGSPFFAEWQLALNVCLVNSGADGLAGVTGVDVTISSGESVSVQ
jgi:hypothetical protein